MLCGGREGSSAVQVGAGKQSFPTDGHARTGDMVTAIQHFRFVQKIMPLHFGKRPQNAGCLSAPLLFCRRHTAIPLVSSPLRGRAHTHIRWDISVVVMLSLSLSEKHFSCPPEDFLKVLGSCVFLENDAPISALTSATSDGLFLLCSDRAPGM